MILQMLMQSFRLNVESKIGGMGSIVKEWFFAFFWAKKEWFLWFLLNFEEWFQNLRGMIPKFHRNDSFFAGSTRNDSSEILKIQGMVPEFKRMIPQNFLNSKEWFLKVFRIPRNDSSKFSELQGMIPQIFKNSKEWFLKFFWTQRNDSSIFFEYQGMIPQIQSWKNQDIFVNLSFSCARD